MWDYSSDRCRLGRAMWRHGVSSPTQYPRRMVECTARDVLAVWKAAKVLRRGPYDENARGIRAFAPVLPVCRAHGTRASAGRVADAGCRLSLAAYEVAHADAECAPC